MPKSEVFAKEEYYLSSQYGHKYAHEIQKKKTPSTSTSLIKEKKNFIIG